MNARQGFAAAICIPALLLSMAPAHADASISNFPWSTTLSVAPGGMQYTGSPALPPATRSVKVTVAIDNPKLLLALHTILASKNKRGRLLFCAEFGEGFLSTLDTRAGMQGLSLTLACFQMMNQIPVANAMARLSVPGCPAVQYRAPMTLVRTAGEYETTLTGSPTATRKMPVRVKCRVAGSSVTMTIRSRTRRSLQTYVGPQLFLGFSADPSLPQPITAKVTYLQTR